MVWFVVKVAKLWDRRQPGRMENVQALRALAVTLVVIYHFWPGRVDGGFIGVDVFFVISGFLITDHLARELDQRDAINLPAFYARRARRLLPAAVLVLVVVTILVVLYLPILRWVTTFKELVASAFYGENWALALKATDYLAAQDAPSPIQHYWSLSTEEQFYLIWPLLMLLGAFIAARLARQRTAALLVTLGIVVAASYVYSIVLTQADPSTAYFSTFTRAWEFGAGGLLAIAKVEFKPEKAASGVLSWLGIVLIVASGFALNGSTPFPGWVAVVPVVGTLFVIVAGMPAAKWSPRPIMAFRPVGFIGDISYSIYLWHWPFVVFGPFILGVANLNGYQKIGFIALAVLLAWLTKRFVEDPIRGWKALTLRKPRWSLLSALGLMLVVVVVVAAGAGDFELRLKSVEASVSSNTTGPMAGVVRGITPNPLLAGDDKGVNENCWSTQDSPKIVKCTYHEGSGPRVALVGDSHAQALSIEVIALAKQEGWQLDTYLKQACSWSAYGPMLKSGADFATNCTQWRAAIEKKLESEHYDAIITTSSVFRVPPKNTAAGMAAAWKPVEAAGTQIYTLMDNPTWPTGDPNECLIAHNSDAAKCTETRAAAFPWEDPQRVAAGMVPGVHVIDQTSLYCTATICFSVKDGLDMYRDEEHFTGTFARSLTKGFGMELAKDGLK